MEKINWSALEYEEKSRTNDWFWALGVIIVAGAITSIIFGNYFFAVLLLIGGFLLGFFAIKKPEMIQYELNEKGLKINDRLYRYEKIKAFHVETENKPMLFIKSERFFMPIISMPINYMQAEIIYKKMIEEEVPEEKMVEHPYEKIMERLGF